jgi:hypothetical protein
VAVVDASCLIALAKMKRLRLLRVLTSVAESKTNGEIGISLYLSVRTGQRHLEQQSVRVPGFSD